MTTTHKTNLDITITLQSAQRPIVGSESSASVVITYTATTTELIDGVVQSNVNQFPSQPPPTPTLKIYDNDDNRVKWELAGSSPGNWTADTRIIGIVIEAESLDILNHPGGRGFMLPSNVMGELYDSSYWAGPGGADDALYRPYLYVFPGIEGQLQVRKTVFFYNNTISLPRDINGLTGALYFRFNYRIYFYSPTVGVWWDDPTVDLEPFSTGN